MRSNQNTLFQGDQVREAFQQSFIKLNPRLLFRNPVMFTVEIGAAVMLVVTIFSLFLYKRFRITQRQKTIIENQKVLVDKAYNELHEKNKEVMDSIRYAKRIQTALITGEKYIENSLKQLIKNN